MRIRHAVALLRVVIVVTCASVSLDVCWTASASQVDAPIQGTTEPKHPHSGVRYLNFVPYKPIDVAEVEWWDRCLGLHTAQKQEVDRLLQTYLSSIATLRKDGEQALWAEAASLSRAGDVTSDPEVGQRFVRLLEMRDSLVSDCCAAENQFFTSVQRILAEEQLANLALVRDIRQIVRTRVAGNEFPGSTINLAVILLEDGLWKEFQPREPEAFSLVLQKYCRESAELLQLNHDAVLMAMKGEGQLSMDPAQKSSEASVQMELYDRYLALSEPCHGAGKRLNQCNVAYLKQLCELLSPENASKLKQRFNNAAYPAVFPNPFVIDAVFETAQRVETLSPDQIQAIAAAAGIYREHSESVSIRMMERYIRFWDEWLEHKSFDQHEQETFRDDMTAFQVERRRIANAAMDEIVSILTGEQISTVTDVIADKRTTFAAHKSKGRGLNFVP